MGPPLQCAVRDDSLSGQPAGFTRRTKCSLLMDEAYRTFSHGYGETPIKYLNKLENRRRVLSLDNAVHPPPHSIQLGT